MVRVGCRADRASLPIGLDDRADADELKGLVDAARGTTIIQSRRERASIYVYPLSIGDPDPLLAVDTGVGPAVLGRSRSAAVATVTIAARSRRMSSLRWSSRRMGWPPVRAADGERLDRIAAFLNRPGRWTGGGVCEFLAVRSTRAAVGHARE